MPPGERGFKKKAPGKDFSEKDRRWGGREASKGARAKRMGGIRPNGKRRGILPQGKTVIAGIGRGEKRDKNGFEALAKTAGKGGRACGPLGGKNSYRGQKKLRGQRQSF